MSLSPVLEAGPGQRITSARPRPLAVGPYRFVKTLGRGVFGKVKLAVHASSGAQVAVKVIEKARLDAHTLRMVRREVMVMKLLDHPHIVALHEVLEGPEHVFIVMEYAPGGEVIDFVIAHGRLQEKLARQLFRQVVAAMAYCHALHVIHRDLKPENLLLDADFRIKIIDFGLSNVYVPGQFLKTFCGSPTYSAPELIEQHAYEGPKIDIWSMGVVLFVLVAGYLPFDGASFSELFNKILRGAYEMPAFLSPECADLIRRMLVVDPHQRCSMDDVRTHPWLLRNGEPVPAPVLPDYVTAPTLDAHVVADMIAQGFDAGQVRASVLAQRFDDNAATYFLMCARRARISPKESVRTRPQLVAPRRADYQTLPLPRHRRHHTWDKEDEKRDSTHAASAPEHTHTRPGKAKARHSPEKGRQKREPSTSVGTSKPHRRPRPSKPAIVRPAERHTLNVPRADKKRREGDEDDFIIPLSRSPLRSAHTTPTATPRASGQSTPTGSEAERAVDELVQSFQTMFMLGAPRRERFPVNKDTTSEQSAAAILAKLKRVLDERHVTYALSSPYCLQCEGGSVSFELEVCSIPNLEVNGVRFHRIAGDAWAYTTLCKGVLADMNLADA